MNDALLAFLPVFVVGLLRLVVGMIG